MLLKSLLMAFLLLTACERSPDTLTASLIINNMTDLRVLPAVPLSIWSVYITAANSTAPALERSVDLLASEALQAGESITLTIDTCGQPLEIQVIFSEGSEQLFNSMTAVECNSSYSQDVL
ncbi:MAG: hypothetical protein OEY29_08720 [Gammaproteobacteria bacterium]|nr:hypothetical protein [Gammaproteobacteria bacterium]